MLQSYTETCFLHVWLCTVVRFLCLCQYRNHDETILHLFSPRFQDRLKDLNSQADSLMTSSAFDTSQVKDKRETINGRFQRIKSMAAARRAKLNESHRLHQFFRDMDDEESWIKCVF